MKVSFFLLFYCGFSKVWVTWVSGMIFLLDSAGWAFHPLASFSGGFLGSMRYGSRGHASFDMRFSAESCSTSSRWSNLTWAVPHPCSYQERQWSRWRRKGGRQQTLGTLPVKDSGRRGCFKEHNFIRHFPLLNAHISQQGLFGFTPQNYTVWLRDIAMWHSACWQTWGPEFNS